jgi:hypothetical protein
VCQYHDLFAQRRKISGKRAVLLPSPALQQTLLGMIELPKSGLILRTEVDEAQRDHRHRLVSAFNGRHSCQHIKRSILAVKRVA